MMNVKRVTLITLLLLSAVSCESVRTVYDANGNKVDDDAPSGEKDLMSHFEKQFQDSFSEEKSSDGVPISRSKRVSRYQQDIDEARREDKSFATRYYGGGKESGLRDTAFAGNDKRFGGDERGEKDSRTAFSTDMRPDFMNESHGIDPTRRYRSSADDRSAFENTDLDSRERGYITGRSRYDGADPNGYVETRRDKTPQPDITDFREYYRQNIHSTRKLLGRDN